MTQTDKIVALAKEKTQDKEKLVLETIDQMKAAGKKITFYSVQKQTGVSKSFIYNNERLRQLISEIRDGKDKRTEEEKATVEAALRLRIQELETENRTLRRQALYKAKYENMKEENKLLKARIEELLGKLY